MPNNKSKNPRDGSQPPQMLARSLASDRARWITGATIPVDGGLKLRAQEMTMKSHDHQKLFSPMQIGPITLSHRVVMAPLTRSRSLQPGDIHSDLMREYYTQRASDGGSL